MLRKLLRRTAIALAALILLACGLYAFHVPLLTAAGRLVTVRDAPARADILFLLGGEDFSRPFRAADLWKAGIAPRIVTVRSEDGPAMKLGVLRNETNAAVRIMERLGVPDSAITVIRQGRGATSTDDEANLLRWYVARHPVRRIDVVTTAFHTRRARWLIRRALRGTTVQVAMTASDDPGFDETDWWRSERGMVAYVTEYIKFAHSFFFQ